MRCFPPFWFLGVYESIVGGPSALPAFTQLAHTGYQATALLMVLAIITYPLAYARSTRQAVEGFIAPNSRSRLLPPAFRVLHATVVRTPPRRAVYHFISQTLFRSQRHRLYLAMYAGIGIALSCVWIVVLPSRGQPSQDRHLARAGYAWQSRHSPSGSSPGCAPRSSLPPIRQEAGSFG